MQAITQFGVGYQLGTLKSMARMVLKITGHICTAHVEDTNIHLVRSLFQYFFWAVPIQEKCVHISLVSLSQNVSSLANCHTIDENRLFNIHTCENQQMIEPGAVNPKKLNCFFFMIPPLKKT